MTAWDGEPLRLNAPAETLAEPDEIAVSLTPGRATPYPAVESDRHGHPGPAASPFPPIADYAFLSDCEVTALVAPSGAIEWMCLPRLDSPSVFGAILDRDAGRFRFGPENFKEPADRRYLPGTMVVET
ncbi:MAG TPA: trehalase-like domain-containing protein, partial [Streptosporangiaceae bacterium]|nr:trehalase-like domain-containing protein [Streptosporangiaceae bacterium]